MHTTGCLGLSILNSLGVYGGCEGDMPTLLSMAIIGSITGEPLFMCNPSQFDTKEGNAVFAHCTVPVTMLKGFCLNTHFESGIGVAVQGTFEPGDCTLFKCEGDLSRYFVQEGMIHNIAYSDMLCRTQIKVGLDDFSYYSALIRSARRPQNRKTEVSFSFFPNCNSTTAANPSICLRISVYPQAMK